MTIQAIRRGLIKGFNPATYTASVLLLEATNTLLSGVPVANHIDGTSGLNNAYCAVLFFDAHNLLDGVIIAVYANGANGLPALPPGRVTFYTGFREVNASVINASNVLTVTPTGNGNVPAGALAVVYKLYFSSPAVGAFVTIYPHGAGDPNAYGTIGNIQVANQTANGDGLAQLDTSGKLDIKANTGNCTVTLYTHGYVF